MAIEFKEVTRGRGKIFVHVAMDAVSGGAEVECHATGGAPVPARLLDVEGVEGKVLMLAVLSVSQTATVRVQDAQGEVVAEASHSFGALASKLQSQVNTATHNQATELIRNCDERLRTGSMEIFATKYVHFSKTEHLLQGRVRVVTFSKEEAEAPLELRFLKLDGTPANIGPYIPMGEGQAHTDDCYGAHEHTLAFSIHIPNDLPSIILWAHSSCPKTPDAFTCLEPHHLKELRDKDWYMRQPFGEDLDYEHWFLTQHKTSERDLALQRQIPLEVQPLFSFVVPLYKTPLPFLDDMVRSVLAQTYGRFELILVNASPGDTALGAAAAAYARQDSRVRVVELTDNQGIAENTNAGIDAAHGDFLCFLDHDDTIEPDLLFWYAEGINRYPTTDLIYCDEDKLIDGHLYNPFLKPDWDPDLLMTHNYVTHLLCVRASLVAELPRQGSEWDGAQDYNLTTRAGERARNVYHARRVLYHWRSHKGSTASGAQAKPWTIAVGKRVVEEHLERLGIAGEVHDLPQMENAYYTSYSFDPEPLVSIVIPNKDAVPVLDRCVGSVLGRSTYRNFEVVVVENNSCDPATFDYYRALEERDPRLRVISIDMGGEFNFSRLINHGFDNAHGDYLLMLNNDTEVIEPAWIEYLLGPCQRDDVGMAGSKLLYPDHTVQHAGVAIPFGGPGHIHYGIPEHAIDYNFACDMTRECSAVTGAALLTKRSVYEELGKLSEDFPIDYNDIDFCLRARAAGYRVVYAAQSVLYHYESVSRGDHVTEASRVKFRVAKGLLEHRWPDYFERGDPYINTNFGPNDCYHKLYV